MTKSAVQTGGEAGARYGKDYRGPFSDDAIVEVKTVTAPEAAQAAGYSGKSADDFSRGFHHGWRASLRSRGIRLALMTANPTK